MLRFSPHHEIKMSNSKDRDNQRKPLLPFSIEEILKQPSVKACLRSSALCSEDAEVVEIQGSASLSEMSKGKHLSYLGN